jgi:magnesium-transporting ATPase (P-type)
LKQRNKENKERMVLPDLFCKIKEVFHPGPNFWKYDKNYCGYPGRESNAIIWAIVLIIILMIIFIAVYASIPYDPTSSSNTNEPSGLQPVDWVTTFGTFVILAVAIVYFQVFYVGKLFGLKFSTMSFRGPTTEAFLKYTIVFGFALGVIAPTLKEMASKDNRTFRTDLFPYYPLVFLAILLGYYIFQFVILKVKLQRK